MIEAQKNKSGEIEIWGDGEQTRSFMYIDDCIKGSTEIMESEIREPINLGSAEMVRLAQATLALPSEEAAEQTPSPTEQTPDGAPESMAEAPGETHPPRTIGGILRGFMPHNPFSNYSGYHPPMPDERSDAIGPELTPKQTHTKSPY